MNCKSVNAAQYDLGNIRKNLILSLLTRMDDEQIAEFVGVSVEDVAHVRKEIENKSNKNEE